MQRCPTCCYKLFTHMHGKREVGLPIAMQVSNLMTIDAKLNSTKAVRKLFHVRPTHHFVFYQLGNAAHDALLTIDHCLRVSSSENNSDLKSISSLR